MLVIVQEMKEEYAKPMHNSPMILENFRKIAINFRVRSVLHAFPLMESNPTEVSDPVERIVSGLFLFVPPPKKYERKGEK